MTTTTTAPVTFKTTVRYSLTTLTIVVPTEKRGVRTLTLNLVPMGDFSDLTATEQAVIYSVMSGKENTSYTLDIAVEDLRTLKAIADRYTPQVAPVTVEPTPVATSTPAPIKTGFTIKGSVTRPTATAAKVERTTEERIVRGMTYQAFSGAEVKETRQEQLVDAMEKAIDSLADSELYMVMYDIPDSKNSVCPNPSWACNQGSREDRWFFPGMWRFGFRLQWSCWILPQESLDSEDVQHLLSHYRQNNIRVDILPQSERARQDLLAIARRNLSEELVKVHTSLITRIATADETLRKAEDTLDEVARQGQEVSEKDILKLRARRDNAVRAVIKDGYEDLKSVVRAAELFDETGQTADLLAAFRRALVAEANAFNAAQRVKQGKVAVETAEIEKA